MRYRMQFAEDLIAEIGPRLSAIAMDWRIHAAIRAILRRALVRRGHRAPRDIEDRQFASYADHHRVPHYSADLEAAVKLLEETGAPRRATEKAA